MIKNKIGDLICVVIAIIMLYWFVANMVFCFRNPGATRTETLTHLYDVINFNKLDKFQR